MRPPFDIPDHWTDEEALALFEFIDAIRDRIWDRYRLQIQSAAKLSQRLDGDVDNRNGQTDLFDDLVQF